MTYKVFLMLCAPLGMMYLAAISVAGGMHTPIPWSPDGHWVAYTVASRPSDQVLSSGWLFEAEPKHDRSRPTGRRSLSKTKYRLWATRADTGESILLEDGRGPLTSPGWNPDGSAIAFGRLVLEGATRGRYEIVVQDAPGHQRVFGSQPIADVPTEAERLPNLAVAWSPDGRYLAVPQLRPRGVAILRADNGRAVASIEEGFMPSWSPDGTKLAFYRAGSPEMLCWVDANFAPPRELAQVDQTVQPPIWARDGLSVLIARRKAQKAGGPPTDNIAEVVRVRLDGAAVEVMRDMKGDPMAAHDAFQGVSFCLDRDADELFFTSSLEGQHASITWYRLRDGATYKLFNPLNINVPMGALAVSPAGKRLAMRIGSPDLHSPPALCAPDTEKLVPLVPDDRTRLECIALLIDTCRVIIQYSIPSPTLQGQSIERPTLLPAPGEVSPPQQQILNDLRRLANIGRPLCDRPAASPTAEPELLVALAEARLFFDYLRQDFPAALESLEAVERSTRQPDRRLRLLGLRAQIFLGLGDVERAQDTISYLQTAPARPGQRLEMTGDTPSLAAEPAPGNRWPDFLGGRAEALRSTLAAVAAGGDPADPANPDAPQPGFGADPLDQQLIPVDPMRNNREEMLAPLIRQIEVEEILRAAPKQELGPPDLLPPRPRLLVPPAPPPVPPDEGRRRP